MGDQSKAALLYVQRVYKQVMPMALKLQIEKRLQTRSRVPSLDSRCKAARAVVDDAIHLDTVEAFREHLLASSKLLEPEMVFEAFELVVDHLRNGTLKGAQKIAGDPRNVLISVLGSWWQYLEEPLNEAPDS